MKAVHFDGKTFVVKELPKPKPGGGEALIRLLAAGVCATDIEISRGYMKYEGIPGHEFVGVVEQCARKDLGGRRVVGEINCPCESCDFCRRGLGGHCPDRTVLGILGRDGCFAEYLTLPEANLHILPESLSDFQGVLVEPLAAAYRIGEQIGPVQGKSIAVLGDGKLGLLVALALASDRAHVHLIGRHAERKSLVATQTIDFLEQGGPKISELRRSFPVAVDCTGTPDGAAAALELIEPTGTLVVKSTVKEPLRLRSDRLVVDEVTVIGSRCGPFDRAIRAMENAEVQVQGLYEKSFPLEEGPAAIEYASRAGALKVLLTPG